MNEVVDQINHYKWMVIHRRWIALTVALLICVIGWNYVQKLPDQYRSNTRIFVNTESVLNNLLRGIALDTDVIENAAIIMQRTLLDRPNLESVIRQTNINLSIDVTDPVQMDRRINQLRSNIRISSVTTDKTFNIYQISYMNDNPQLAKDVVEVLLNLFVETVLGSSRKDTASASQFLDEQIALYDQKQKEAENKLMQFKQKNLKEMPDDGKGIYRRVFDLDTSINETKLALKEAANRSSSLKAQIDYLQNNAQNSSSSADVVESPLEIRISNLQKSLDELLLQYTEQHPKVTSIRRVMKQLEQRKQEQEIQDIETGTVRNDFFNTNLYQDLNVLLSQSLSEVSALQARLEELQNRRETMTTALLTLPEIEAELVSLNRDYAINKELYQDLVMRRESSDIATKASQTGDELLFRILEPPLVPLTPIGPNRISLVTMVLIASLIAGVGLTILFELIRSTFYYKVQLQDTIGLPVLGIVSMSWTNREIARRRLGIVIFCLASFILLIIYAGLIVHNLPTIGFPDIITRIIG